MCSDGWEFDTKDEEVEECPDCGTDCIVNRTKHGTDYSAIAGCNWSPCICETCGSRPCDQSC